MADYTIINADVGNNSGEIKAVKFNTEDVLKLTFKYDDNSAIWEKYIPEDLYIIGVDGNRQLRWKESSTNLNTQELAFSMLIKSPNAGDPENDKNTINIVSKYYSLYPSYSIIDNFGYILNNPFNTEGTLTLNNKTYNYSPSESTRNIQYLFNYEFTSKIVKVPWQIGNEGISYIQDSGNDIKVIQTLVYYPQDFISVDNILDFDLFLFDYETGTHELITNDNISEKTSGFITNYDYTVNTTVIDEETTDVYPTLTLTFTCTKNNTGEYRDAFFIVGRTTFNTVYSGLHVIQEPRLQYSTRGYTYSGSVYYLNEDYSEMLDNFNNRLPSSPNYQQKADYYSDNHGITDFSGLFSIGHVMNSSLTKGNNNRYYIVEQRQKLINQTIDMGTGFIAVPHELGIMTDHYPDNEQLTEDDAIKWAGVTYTIYKTQIDSNIS